MTNRMKRRTFHVDNWDVTLSVQLPPIDANGEGPSAPTIHALTIALREDAPDDVRDRGINSGVLRRIELRLPDLLGEIVAGAGARTGLVSRQAALKAVDALKGRQPRGDSDYYRDLRTAENGLRLSGEREPLALMAERLGVKHGTMRQRMSAAREDYARWRERVQRIEADPQVRQWFGEFESSTMPGRARELAQRWQADRGEELDTWTAEGVVRWYSTRGRHENYRQRGGPF